MFANPDNITLAEVRRHLRSILLPKHGEREASEMAKIVMLHLKGWNFTQLLAKEDSFTASDYILNRSAEIAELLLRDMPLQYALGETVFYGLNLNVRRGVLIPRPETEELVDMIIRENKRNDLHVLDLCTGSGAIALALARTLPFSDVEAIDLSPVAVEVAKANADALKIRARIDREDIFSFVPQSQDFDIIVSNPPYVDESEKKDMEPNVLEYEPEEAIFVPDDDPLKFYKRIARISIEALKPEGRLYLEINPRHAAELKKMLENSGFYDVEIRKDIHGKDRFATAKR